MSTKNSMILIILGGCGVVLGMSRAKRLRLDVMVQTASLGK